MVIEARMRNVRKAQIFGEVGTGMVSNDGTFEVKSSFDKCSLEFLVLVNDLDAIFKVGSPILSGRGEVAINRHLVWRSVGSICWERPRTRCLRL